MADTRDRTGPNNPNWKGGRVVEPRGYVLIRVGKDHPLTDVRGYAYEHRLNGEEMVGRPLKPGEQVHHVREGEKAVNTPENLEVLTVQEHRKRHRKSDKGLRDPGEANPQIPCACGCRALLLKFDTSGRPRRFLPAHNNRLRDRGPDGRMV